MPAVMEAIDKMTTAEKVEIMNYLWATALPSSDVSNSPKRLAHFAGCEPETSQGAKLKHRRVRS